VLKDGRPGVACLLAGVAGEHGSVAALDPAPRNALRDAGFRVLEIGDSNSTQWDYVVRDAFPDKNPEVLAGENLEAQGRSLAAWIDRAFRDVLRVIARRAT